MEFSRYVAILVTIFLIAVGLAVMPSHADNVYPYSLGDGSKFVSCLQNSTADSGLFEFSSDGKNWRVNFDKQRKPFAVIGICNYPNGTIEEINKMAKEKIYTPRFSSSSTEPYVKGLEVHSGHIARDGNETFIPFHYLVYPDGNEVKMFDQPLINTDGLWKVNQVPWAMGNWDMNCETIAIAVLVNGNITREQNKTIDKLALSLKGYNPSARIVSRISK